MIAAEFRRFGAAVAVLLTVMALAGCGPSGPTVEIATAGGPVTFGVEVVATDAAREQGLMYRKSLDADRGMLFLFDEEEDHAFWMKNTLIPLDMLFIGSDWVVAGIQANATPLSTRSLSVGKPSRYVLEIAGGEAARRGILPGARVTPHGVPGR